MTKNHILKGVYFSKVQLELGGQKAASLGMTFNEWLKYLVTKEIEQLVNLYDIEEASFEQAKEMDINIEEEFEDNDLPY